MGVGWGSTPGSARGLRATFCSAKAMMVLGTNSDISSAVGRGMEERACFLETEFRVSHMEGKCFPAKVYPQLLITALLGGVAGKGTPVVLRKTWCWGFE